MPLSLSSKSACTRRLCCRRPSHTSNPQDRQRDELAGRSLGSAVEATVTYILGLQKRLIALGAAIPKRLVISVAVNELPRPLSIPATSATVAAHLCRPPGPPRESMVFTHGSNVVDHNGGSGDCTARPYRRWFQGVIASLRRVFLMVSCRRGFVEGEC